MIHDQGDVFTAQALSRRPVAIDARLQLVESLLVRTPGFESLRDTHPEVIRDLFETGVQKFDIIEHFVVVVVLRAQPEHLRLDPEVDVFGDDDDSGIGMLLLELQRGREYDVVRNCGTREAVA